MTTVSSVSENNIKAFCSQHQLPDEFQSVANDFYQPFAAKLPALLPGSGTRLLGINGAQGTGKSTLAAYIETVSYTHLTLPTIA